MKNIIAFVILIGFSLSTFAARHEWEKLFNGKDLTGWTLPIASNGAAPFTVENGEIVGTSKTNTGNSYLITTRTFGDFILEYEMKMDEGLNSGVQIRSESNKEVENYRVHGYQVECDDSQRAWSAGIYDEARRGWLYSMEFNQDGRNAYKHSGWNKYRVEAIGNSIRTWLNGVPCANLVDDMTPVGIIGLQVHVIGNDEALAGKTIRWKNVRIMTKNLEASLTPMEKSVVEISFLNNRLTEREKADGWKLLWDGKSTAGWRGAMLPAFPQKGWTIEDGILISNPGANRDGGDIVTVKKYKNFILEADFKITKGADSGIKYYVQNESGSEKGAGFEFQIIDDEKNSDAKLGISGDRTIGSIYDLVKADAQILDATKPVKRVNNIGQWNRLRIEINGDKIIHILNGLKIVDISKGSQTFKDAIAKSIFRSISGFGEFEDGYLLLQGKDNEVAFRNLKIKEL